MKATHFGTCQICGRNQKLPGGKLSKHGYTVQWGFFSGTCPGSDALPFEQDCSLIKGAIERVSADAARLEAESAEYKSGKQLPGNLAWYHHYFGAGSRAEYNRTRGYRWVKAAVRIEEIKSALGGYTYFRFFVTPEGGKESRCDSLTYATGVKTLDQARTILNTKYAEQQLDGRVKEFRSYIHWQRARVSNWKPAALRAIEGNES